LWDGWFVKFFGSGEEQQIPPLRCGMTNKKTDYSNSKKQMRGFLHCATHDETMSRFGRNDESFGGKG
jgi:hypothetical protein